MLKAIKETLGDAYYWLLWISGAALFDYELDELKLTGGDRITYWMRRSQSRLGRCWLVAVAATIIIANIRLYTALRDKQWGWLAGTIVFDVFCAYVIPHVYGLY